MNGACPVLSDKVIIVDPEAIEETDAEFDRDTGTSEALPENPPPMLVAGFK